MALDPQLLEILACPDDKGPLLYFADEQALYNPRLKRRYDVRDDIPVMLIDEATTVDDGEHQLSLGDRDHPYQDGPLASRPAPHTGAHRALAGRSTSSDLRVARCTSGEPDPWPSLVESSAPAHEP